jgi:AhpD family alkylhydroperoxidase
VAAGAASGGAGCAACAGMHTRTPQNTRLDKTAFRKAQMSYSFSADKRTSKPTSRNTWQ